jgi:hypothetical protein
MDLQMFDDFRPDTWQESGGILVVSVRIRSTRWRMLRRAERFLASAAAATLLTVAVSNGPVSIDVTLAPANAAGTIRSTPLFTTEAQFPIDGEISPQLWGKLLAYVDRWPDLPPEEEGSSSEPFV